MSKTVMEFLNDLPPDVREKALNNLNQNQEMPVENMQEALIEAFDWEDGKDGPFYWASVWLEYYKESNENLNKKPKFNLDL